MYETPCDDFRRQDSAGDSELHAIAWPTLVARLAAQRDLRRVLLSRDTARGASFNADAAAWLSSPARQNEHDVNRDALVDSKQAWAKTGAAADEAAEGDREKL